MTRENDSHIALSQWYTYGMHRYRTANETIRVLFRNEEKGIKRVIVDEKGRICGFPGIEEKKSIKANIENGSLQPVIRYRTDFERHGDRILMLWQVQPDGRYWEDEDGFGMESDEEIVLYAWINDEGRFENRFRLYSIGNRTLYDKKN